MPENRAVMPEPAEEERTVAEAADAQPPEENGQPETAADPAAAEVPEADAEPEADAASEDCADPADPEAPEASAAEAEFPAMPAHPHITEDVVGVRFKKMGKMYYFDPNGLDPKPEEHVIVETARGMEFGTVSMGVTAVNDNDVVKPLKKVVRIADEEDIRRHEENEAKKGDAMRICQEKIAKHHLEMKLIDVEYTFDNNKIIFYFTADGRVDFRELVKDLAGVFKMRIELRQIGVRDEAKMLGGIGCCGRELCCATWLTDFQPVSIKMTKTQNLSLNPTKISGVCGRLMCCLKYENDTYLELGKDLPSVNERVKTEDGIGKVIETNILKGTVRVRMYTGEKDENGQDKLGSDIIECGKEDIVRLGKRRNGKTPERGGSHGCGKCPKMMAEAALEAADAAKEKASKAGASSASEEKPDGNSRSGGGSRRDRRERSNSHRTSSRDRRKDDRKREKKPEDSGKDRSGRSGRGGSRSGHRRRKNHGGENRNEGARNES